jgi:hypothetical protein
MQRDFTSKSIWEEMEEAQTIRSSNVPATGKFGIALVHRTSPITSEAHIYPTTQALSSVWIHWITLFLVQ